MHFAGSSLFSVRARRICARICRITSVGAERIQDLLRDRCLRMYLIQVLVGFEVDEWISVFGESNRLFMMLQLS